jgi:hypothetical protein
MEPEPVPKYVALFIIYHLLRTAATVHPQSTPILRVDDRANYGLLV